MFSVSVKCVVHNISFVQLSGSKEPDDDELSGLYLGHKIDIHVYDRNADVSKLEGK